MPRKGQKGSYSYGRQFVKRIKGRDRKVMYRYLNKDKRTKTLVFVGSKKPVSGETVTMRGRRYDGSKSIFRK